MEKNYFGAREEQAVRDFLVEENLDKKNLIYESFLKEPLRKMAEALINRYKLHLVSTDIDTQINDGLSFLHTKMIKFNIGLDKKAYSYYGTTLKHYFLGEKRKEDGLKLKHGDYEVLYPIICEDSKFSYSLKDDEEVSSVENIINAINDIINQSDNYSIVILGEAILQYFEDCSNMDCDSKVNRNTWLSFVRDFTQLSDKDIREGIKSYKIVYKQLFR